MGYRPNPQNPRPSTTRHRVEPDRYLSNQQSKIPGIIVGTNLYIYALDNPANFSYPTGRLAFLTVLLIAVVVGAVLGMIGAAVNEVARVESLCKTLDQPLLVTTAFANNLVLALTHPV